MSRTGVILFLLALIRVYYWLIIVRVLLSWIPLPDNDLVRTVYRLLYDATEPYLGLFRRIMPSLGRGGIGIDLSPILAIMVLIVIENFVRGAL
ncbi:MAG: YggT family protein [Thermoleophilia bacterium]